MMRRQQESPGVNVIMSYLGGSSIKGTCVATNHYCRFLDCLSLSWPIFATVGRLAWGRVSLFSQIYWSPDHGLWLRRKCANLIRILNMEPGESLCLVQIFSLPYDSSYQRRPDLDVGCYDNIASVSELELRPCEPVWVSRDTAWPLITRTLTLNNQGR